MKLNNSFLIVHTLVLMFACSRSAAQDIIFNKVRLPGFNFSGFVCVTQDRNGYMWVGAETGLYRYDGYNFKIYVNDPFDSNSLAQSHIEWLYADSKGIIWIATWQKGLDRLDPATGIFTHFRHKANDSTSISNDVVRAILEDHNGILWIGTHGGLSRFDPKTKKFTNYKNDRNNPSSLSSNKVRALYEDRKGTLWVGTGSLWENDSASEGGLNRMDTAGKFTRFIRDPKNPHSLIDNNVRAIFEDSKGVFWIGTAGDGLHTMDREKGTFERHLYDPVHPEILSRPPLVYSDTWRVSDFITFINEDAKGDIWIGTMGNGVSRYDRLTNKITHYGGKKDSTSGFNGEGAWSIHNSKDGILWIGGVVHGLLYSIDPFQKNIPHFYLGSSVRAFSEQPPNLIWIATSRGLIRKNLITGETTTFQNNKNNLNSLSSSTIRSMYYDDNGTLWVGTDSGLNQFNIAKNTFIRIKNNPKDTNTIVASEDINVLMSSSSDSLWIGTGNYGVDLMNITKKSFTHFYNYSATKGGSVSENTVYCMKIDDSGYIWIGSDGGGLDFLNPKTRKRYNFLKDLAVSCLYKDYQGILWAGTGQGLFRSRSIDATSGFIKFIEPGTNIDLAKIASIQGDNQKNLWVSSSLGIYKLNLSNNQTTLFASNHGVDGSQLTLAAGYKGKGGEIYFGDATGYYVISPDQLTINSKEPEIIFTNFRIGGKEVLASAKGPLDTTIEQANEISLLYDQNNFSIDFAGLSYNNPQYNRHLYMLQNYDKEWREAYSEKTASYFNVPPGKYTFRIKASNSDGVWAERDMQIIISPPWWRTWWAYALYGICLLALVFGFDQLQRKRIINRERERTRDKELQHAKEIEKAYADLKATQARLVQSEKMASLGDLTAGIAHEIQNPLNFVTNFSDVNTELIDEADNAIASGNQNEAKALLSTLRENQEKIKFHGQRADAIVKGMLQHSRASTGQKESTNINALADEYLRLAYHGLRAKDKSFKALLKTDLDPNIGTIDIVPQDIGRVLLNLFNNSFYAVSEKKKLAFEGYEPTLFLSTKKLKGKVVISVKDNGDGIPQRVIDKIFQPFFTTKPTGQGTGLGLSMSYDVISAHAGQLEVYTKEGEYAEFVIELPS